MKAKYSDMYLQLGLKIAYYRKLRGLTQEQLAARLQVQGCDLTRSALAKIEVGQRHLYPDEIKALTEVLAVSYEQLFIRHDPPKNEAPSGW